jgi:hypothetical protein
MDFLEANGLDYKIKDDKGKVFTLRSVLPEEFQKDTKAWEGASRRSGIQFEQPLIPLDAWMNGGVQITVMPDDFKGEVTVRTHPAGPTKEAQQAPLQKLILWPGRYETEVIQVAEEIVVESNEEKEAVVDLIDQEIVVEGGEEKEIVVEGSEEGREVEMTVHQAQDGMHSLLKD